MTIKILFQLIFLICLYGCSNNSDGYAGRKGQKQFGLYIENGPRQGFQYFDSAKTEYNYRYNTITITNDTIIPVQLEIGFSYTEKNIGESNKSKVFLLPRHLTPSEQHFDESMSDELKRFLDYDIDKPEHLNKTLNTTEKCVLTFGVLTNTKYPDPTTPYETKLLISNESSSALSLKLKINDTLIIPCGIASYEQQR